MYKTLRKIIAISLFVCAIVANVLAERNEETFLGVNLSLVDSFASTERALVPVLTCYCALMSDQSCAVNNNGSSVCAGGENAKCWEYNRNCN